MFTTEAHPMQIYDGSQLFKQREARRVVEVEEEKRVREAREAKEQEELRRINDGDADLIDTRQNVNENQRQVRENEAYLNKEQNEVVNRMEE